MKRPRKPRPPGDDYEVGYKRPPVATRFQPGRSGNPRGRPRGVKSAAAALQEALATKVTVQINGRPRTVTMQEAMLKGLVNSAVRQQLPAIRTVLELQSRLLDAVDSMPPETDAVTEDEEEIMRNVLARHGVGSASAPPAVAEGPDDAADGHSPPPADDTTDPKEG